MGRRRARRFRLPGRLRLGGGRRPELGTLGVQLEEHEPATRAFRAVTLMKTVPAGSPEGATAQLRALAYYHLGRMAYIQGDRRKARLMIDKAVADDPTLEEARTLLDQLRTA